MNDDKKKANGKEDSWQRRIFWLTLLGIIITTAALVFNSKCSQSENISHDLKVNLQEPAVQTKTDPEEPKIQNVSVRVKKAFISPANLSIPAYFFIEFTSTSTQRPKDFNILFDFGRASVIDCASSPVSQTIWSPENEQSRLTLGVSIIENSQSIYAACLINIPDFPNVVVAGGNLTYETNYDLKRYELSENTNAGGVLEFLKIIGGGVVIVLFIAFAKEVLRG